MFFGGLGVLRSTFVRYGLRASFVVLACCLSHAQTPTITSISPNPVGIGQSVTISGTNFGTSGSVTFSGVAASTSSWASTAIIATVPVGTTTGNIVVTAGGHSSSPYPFTLNNGPVSYVYDDLGRLIAVIDVNGNAAEYAYDSVGNIQIISHFTSAQVSIIDFGPESGPTGALVTINGTGFSTTPSQDTVKFNSVTATVSSATNSQLQVTVPSAATTGPISVTSPNGSATSTMNFAVTSSNGLPTIIGFSPSSGVAGTAVNLVGTNFDLTPSNDELRQNASQAVVSAATSTTIATTIPAATASGYFTLLTPEGNTVSSQDFYIPFGGYPLSTIGFTARIPSLGGSQAVTLGAGQIALVLFDGVGGQSITVSETGSTLSTCSIYLIAPDNTIVSANGCASGTNSTIPITLNKTGTYTIGIYPGSSSGGLTVTFAKDYVGHLVLPPPGTSAAAVTVPPAGNLAAGQNAILTFYAVANQKVSINLPSSSFASCLITLYGQSSPSPITQGNCYNGAGNYIDAVTLPTTETYSVIVAPQGTSTGNLSLSLNNDADVTTPAISINNPTAQWSATALGQDVRLTFTPNSSQTQIAIYATDLSSTAEPYLNLVSPSGSIQATLQLYPNSQLTSFMDTQPVIPNQPYQLWVEHYLANVESQTLQIISVPPNFTGTLTVPAAGVKGTAVQVPTTGSLAVGQNATLTFSATAGQKLSFNVLGSTIGSSGSGCNLTVMGPSPSTTYITGGSAGSCAYQGPTYVDTVTMPTTGTYTVLIDPQGASTGTVSISINNDQDVTTPAISIGEGAITFKTTVAGQDMRLSFTPTASQPRIAVTATAPTTGYIPVTTLNLWNGTAVQASIPIYNNTAGQIYFLDTQPVNANQQYQLWLQHSGTNFGGETLTIRNVPADISHTVTVGGAAYSFSTVAGQNANIQFTISTTESVTVNWTSGTYPSTLNCYVTVTGPSPSTNDVGNDNGCNAATGSFLMNSLAPGTYNILIDPRAQSAGGMSLSVTTP
jgi:YD repeat-containing protein